MAQLSGAEQPDSGSVLKSKKITVRATLAPAGARGDAKTKKVTLEPDSLIEVELTDGQILWMRGDDYRERFGGAAARGDSGELAVPSVVEPLPSGQQRARGALSIGVRFVRMLGFDPAEASAKAVAKEVEDRLKLRLSRCRMVANQLALGEAGSISNKDTHLLFLHGTGSSTFGSFGDLWTDARSSQFRRLHAAYGDRVLAFEHRSLTESPIQNAIDLLQHLPEGMTLHVVSHSRGGLVGELLCHAGFSEDEFALLKGEEQKRLRELDRLLRAKKPKVERFVRVACPALGTTLASGRLDRWFSVMGTVCGNTVPGSPLASFFGDLSDFIAAVVKERTDPAKLAGLEAMMPESAFIRLVNWQKAAVPGDLSVIAGDIDPSSLFAKALIWVTDRFYDGDHDLVVNTPSMYGGARREGEARVSFHKGPEVNHFHYFQNEESANRVVDALTMKGELAGFEPLVKPQRPIARSAQKRSGVPQPTVFVLPGIMGSELEVSGNPVWMSIPDLVLGRLTKLDINARGVQATGLFPLFYSNLVEYLSETHRVIPFPFDWRLPMVKEAERLAREVKKELEAAKAQKQPVRFVCHSMGGLVARTMAAQNAALWRELCEQPGMRLVMLGTPNGGSHAITELLVAQSSTLRKLSRLDFRHGRKGLLEVISRFPGVLAMLPNWKDNGQDYFAGKTWDQFHAKHKDSEDWVTPDAADLGRALEFRKLLDGAPADPKHMIYVAGVAEATAAVMKLDGGKIRYDATVRGDGTVTWDSGILPGVPTYYMPANHGNMVTHQDGFPAIRELLDRGQTGLLKTEPPVSRAAEVLFPMPLPVDDLYPNQEVLAASVLGGNLAAAARPETGKAEPVGVRVLYGDLQYATYPVAVGHYVNDILVSAEGYIDGKLNRALSQRHQLGLYPGLIGTSAVFPNPSAGAMGALKGAVVIGLGQVGSLTGSQLTQGFKKAMLEYALSNCGETDKKSLGISTLLIGANAGGIPVSDSVYAVAQGVREANQELDAAKMEARIAYIEFIELYEDRAIQAAHVLHQVQDGIVFQGKVEEVDGGRRRVRFEEPPGWWQRLQIHGDPEKGKVREAELRFTAVTRRARSEKQSTVTQRMLVDRFIEQSIRTTQDNRAIARTLFELLLPNTLKDQAPDQDSLILMLDKGAARYPWELLEDPARKDGPFAVKHGMLRQLETEDYREYPRSATKNTALVIGDPVSKFPELSGAQQEARAVHEALKNGRFEVGEPLIRQGAEDVITALYREPYKLLHLAGHGVYNYVPEEGSVWSPSMLGEKDAAFTGMIIGDGIVLSPGEIRHMRAVPELVFINCCHLGHIESTPAPGAGDRNEHRNYNRIAANVATEFIDMGVRAVVAAGWAVDDSAALTFARTFYREILSGRRFGDAVLAARRATYQSHANTNTWGAYQCYGDPDYKLVTEPGSNGASSKPFFVSPSEALAEINNAAATANNRQNPAAAMQWLEQLESFVGENQWVEKGDIAAALGHGFHKAGAREKAIQYLTRSQNAEDSRAALRDVAQLANLEIRTSAADAAGGNAAARKKALETIDWWIDKAEVWRKHFGDNSERLNLLASARKRRASVTGAKADLRKMAAAYKLSFEHKQSRGEFDTYPLLNWLVGAVAADWMGDQATARIPDFATLLARAQEALGARQRNVWESIMPVDANLLEALYKAGDKSWKRAEFVKRFTRDYKAVRGGVGLGSFSSVLEHLDFLIRFAGAKKEIAKALADLRAALSA